MDTYERLVTHLTASAMVGDGHSVRAFLDQMPFPERIRMLREMQCLSDRHHCMKPDDPYLQYIGFGDSRQPHGFVSLELKRNQPHKGFLGLMDSSDSLYMDFLDLETGNEAVIENNIRSGNFSGGARFKIDVPW